VAEALPYVPHERVIPVAASRRDVGKLAVALAVGAAAGVAGVDGLREDRERYPLPYYAGYAASVHADRRTEPRTRQASITWGVNTTKKLIALTFDDGPMPNWTPQVHEILADQRVRATFFLIGERVIAHGSLLADLRPEHEVGNHTWAHRDLAEMDYAAARDAIERGARAIATVVGRAPTLLRPPYGHLAGSSLLAAADLGCSIVLWTHQMVESDYPDDPVGHAEQVVRTCTPGTILLGHDAGSPQRLVAIRGLPDIIRGLRAGGFEFVTVSELLAER
jgi:peptidoglycan/xylan/chitin deacetylase (PgdA/CDA1 family)